MMQHVGLSGWNGKEEGMEKYIYISNGININYIITNRKPIAISLPHEDITAMSVHSNLRKGKTFFMIMSAPQVTRATCLLSNRALFNCPLVLLAPSVPTFTSPNVSSRSLVFHKVSSSCDVAFSNNE